MRFNKTALFMSIIGIIFSIVLIFSRGLNLGIDFSGGILIEVRVLSKPNIAEFRKNLSQISDFQIQNSENTDFLIRVKEDKESNIEQSTLVKEIQKIITDKYPDAEFRKIDYVGPQIGSELIKDAIMALLLSFVFIMIYIWFRFDWQFGVGAIFSLIHDAFLTLGFFSITQLEFNLTSIAAILTIIGYSVNDSVVIYDRIRENLNKLKTSDLNKIINLSINSTLSRTILTASTTLTSLLALILFGGEVLKSFSIATFFGIILGTYSSIYISAPILIYFDPRRKKDN
jgi:preprotein translocase subunit SecF